MKAEAVFRSATLGYVLVIGLALTTVFRQAEAGDFLTRQGLEEMAQAAESAAARRDVNGVLKYLSPDVRIVLKTHGRTGDKTVSMDYKTYKAMLERNWAAATKYIYKQEKLDIKLSSDQKEATLTALVRETYVIGGRSTSGIARETATVRLVRGKPMTVEVLAEQLGD